MIDKLISSDLAAMAVEDRQGIVAGDALVALTVAPVPKRARAARSPWHVPVAPIIVIAIAGGVLFEGAALLDGNVKTFNEARQLAVALVVAVIAMLGLFGLRRLKPGRPLASVVAAGMFTAVAVVSVFVGWHQHRTDCVFFDGAGGTIGPCHVNPLVTTNRFVLFSFAGALAVAAVVARLVRREGPRAWSVSAKIVLVTVLITWVGVNRYADTWVTLIDFHYEPLDTLGSHGELQPAHIHIIKDSMSGDTALIYAGFRDYLRASSEPGQWNATEAGLFMLLLALSIGVACTREQTRPSRWLAMLESPAIVPLGVVVATGSLLLAMGQWSLFELRRGSPDDIPWYGAWASAGAVVAYASMLLRRRRREALS